MRCSLSHLLAPSAAVYVAFGLFFSVFTSDAYAGQAAEPQAAPVSRQDGAASPKIAWPDTPFTLSPHSLAELKADLDQGDRMAVLEAIHVGLSDAPDGATYMWRRHNGKIAGSVRPTTSFIDREGKVCRFLVFQLLLGEHLHQIEGIGCRQDDKSWVLEG
jgi:hypothetical protein